MSVVLLGSEGSMGKRYQSILEYLDVEHECFDIDADMDDIEAAVIESDGIIISTPTEAHVGYIRKFIDYKKPILCEKPITKNILSIRGLLAEIHYCKCNFTMMMQYKELVDPSDSGPSYYNYFRTGNDGLIWDAIQIIGLAKDDVRVSNDSPIWKCMINGRKLSLADMDLAYIKYVRRWLEKPGQSLTEIRQIHEKTNEFEKVKGIWLN